MRDRISEIMLFWSGKKYLRLGGKVRESYWPECVGTVTVLLAWKLESNSCHIVQVPTVIQANIPKSFSHTCDKPYLLVEKGEVFIELSMNNLS